MGFALGSRVALAAIEVTVDRNPVALDESFQILFRADESPDGDPDFSPLQSDFEILGQSRNEQFSWINGQSQRQIEWRVNVLAKRSGVLPIPPIAFGQTQSQAGRVTVIAHQPATTPDEDLFIRLETEPSARVYVQAQWQVIARVYHRVTVAQGRLDDPVVGDAVVMRLGDDKTYETTLNGVRYGVIERRYAIFPQRSGRLTLEPLRLTAQVLSTGTQRFNGLFTPQISTTRRVSAAPLTIDVLPVPNHFDGAHWLPAEQVHFEENWSVPPDRLKVGEPVTRTLSLLVNGATIGQLPDLVALVGTPHSDALANYPEQPLLRETPSDDGMIALREDKLALIPQRAGEFTLPALEIPWWNTREDRLEIARIPARTLQVAAAAGSAHDPPAISDTAAPLPQTPAPATSDNTPPASRPAATPQTLWPVWALIATSGWLGTLVYMFRLHKRLTRSRPTPTSALPAEEIAWRELLAACRCNDVSTTQQLLFKLKHRPELRDPTVRAAIARFHHALYSKQRTPWQGDELYQALQQATGRISPSREARDELAPLFKL